MQQDNWINNFNLEGRIRTSQNEVGGGVTSRVYMATLDGITIAVKQLKCYSPRLAPAASVLTSNMTTLCKYMAFAQRTGKIVMEYCHRVLDNYTLRTLLLHCGN